jgi:serine/threonine-protein kinase
MNSPTLTGIGGTQLGVILGTAAYMAPEQARGRAVDRRADIWAFGVVLWEMLAGRRLFEGETVSDTLAAVLTREPPWLALPANVPAEVRRLLERCLERDPRRRLRDIGEARLVLDRLAAGAGELPAVVFPPSRFALRSAPWAIAILLASALAWLWIAGRNPAAVSARPRILALRLPENVVLPLDVRGVYGQTGFLAISPDGLRVAFVGGLGDEARLYLRELDRAEVSPIEGTRGASSPFFSADGRWIGYFSSGRLRKVSVAGGRPIDLVEAGLDRGAVWCPDGSIVYTPNVASGLFRLPAAGGEPQPLSRLEPGERTHRWPALLPGGREVAFTVGEVGRPGDYEDSVIDAVDLATGTRRPLFRGASMVRFTPTGHALLGREGQVLALPLEGAPGRSTEYAVRMADNVAGVPSSGIVHFDVGADGTLVYAERDPGALELELAWLTRTGELIALGLPPGEYRTPSLSPDGQRVAMGIGPGGGRASDVWIHDLRSGALTRLSFEGTSAAPIWSQDGRSVSYATVLPTGGDAFKERLADGSAEPRTLLRFEESLAHQTVSWMPDGSLLGWEDAGTGFAGNLIYFPPGAVEPLPFARTAALEYQAVASPDGRFVAYVSDDSGEPVVYVQPFPPTGAKWQVAAPGSVPSWSPDGRELFYVQGRDMMAVPVTTSATFALGAPRKLLEVPLSVVLASDTSTNYDVAPDGRFLVVRQTSKEFQAGHLVVALDWFETLRRRVPLGGES